MNSNEINAVIDNICNKLGTTANMLIPELSKYMIVKYLFVIIMAIMFYICAGVCIAKVRKMRREEGALLKRDDDYMTNFMSKLDNNVDRLLIGTRIEADILAQINKSSKYIYYDEDDYAGYTILTIIGVLAGSSLLFFGITRIFGWSQSPHAMAVMYLMSLGGV